MYLCIYLSMCLCIYVSMYKCIYVSMLSTYLSIGLSVWFCQQETATQDARHKRIALAILVVRGSNYTHLYTLQWAKVMGIVTGHGSYSGLRPFPGLRTTTAYTLARPQESGIQDQCRSWTENLDLDNSIWFWKLWNLPWTSAMWACHVLSRLFSSTATAPGRLHVWLPWYIHGKDQGGHSVTPHAWISWISWILSRRIHEEHLREAEGDDSHSNAVWLREKMGQVCLKCSQLLAYAPFVRKGQQPQML